MTDHPVIVGIDGSESSEHALLWAADYAAGKSAELRVVLVRSEAGYVTKVAPQPVWPWPIVHEPVHTEETETTQLLAEATRAVLPPNHPAQLTFDVVDGSPAETLIHVAKQSQAELLVVGRRGITGLKRLLLGSVSDECARYASCPVAVIGQQREAQETQDLVIVGVDGSDQSKEALTWAADYARAMNCRLDVVHGWEPPITPPDSLAGLFPGLGGDDEELGQLAGHILTESVEQVAKSHPELEVNGRVLRGYPSELLINDVETNRAQALVIGNRGFGGFSSLLLGSVADQCLHHSKRPVVIVRPHTSE